MRLALVVSVCLTFNSLNSHASKQKIPLVLDEKSRDLSKPGHDHDASINHLKSSVIWNIIEAVQSQWDTVIWWFTYEQQEDRGLKPVLGNIDKYSDINSIKQSLIDKVKTAVVTQVEVYIMNYSEIIKNKSSLLLVGFKGSSSLPDVHKIELLTANNITSVVKIQFERLLKMLSEIKGGLPNSSESVKNSSTLRLRKETPVKERKKTIKETNDISEINIIATEENDRLLRELSEQLAASSDEEIGPRWFLSKEDKKEICEFFYDKKKCDRKYGPPPSPPRPPPPPPPPPPKPRRPVPHQYIFPPHKSAQDSASGIQEAQVEPHYMAQSKQFKNKISSIDTLDERIKARFNSLIRRNSEIPLIRGSEPVRSMSQYDQYSKAIAEDNSLSGVIKNEIGRLRKALERNSRSSKLEM